MRSVRRAAAALLVAIAVLALPGRVRDPSATVVRQGSVAPGSGSVPVSTRAPDAWWATPALAVRYSGEHGARRQPPIAPEERTAAPPVRGHLLDGCVEPLDPAPPIPDGFVREQIGPRVRAAWAAGSIDPDRVSELARYVDEGIETAAAVTDTSPRPEVTLVVYESLDGLREARALPDWVHAVYDGAIRAGADGRHLRQILRHEATHAQLHHAIGCLPTWLNEGLAKYVQGHAGDIVEPWMRQIDEDEVLPFGELAAPTLLSITDESEAGVHYAQSLGMVLWLEEEVGIPDAVDRLVAERIGPDDLWATLMPDRPPEGYLSFLVERLEPPVDGPCRVAATDVDALRCLSP